MRVVDNGDSIIVYLSASDTERFARRWPCSELSGKRIVACFDRNGLYDLAVNGRASFDGSADEFNAITSDAIADAAKRKPSLLQNTAYFVACGQFQRTVSP
ncbi:MAG: hypothetical protein IPH13_20900 [Planctomycetes bacterium]|nr:hypothetical protein [Planctomycetota bacterium]